MFTNILKTISQKLLLLFLFLLPWQTVYIAREIIIDNVKWEYATIGFYGTEIIFWLSVIFFGISIVVTLKNSKKLINKKRIKIFFSKIFEDTKISRALRILLMVQGIIIYLYIKNIYSKDLWLGLEHILYLQQGFLLVILLLVSDIKKESIYKAIVYGSVIPSSIGIMQFFSQTTIANSWLGLSLHPVLQPGTSVIVSELAGRVMRAYGTFAHPNIFGGYLVVVMASYLALANVNDNKKYYAIFILLFMALFFTFSRSAWLAMAALLLLHYPKVNFKALVKPILFIFMGVFFILSLFNQDIIKTRSSVAASQHEIASVAERYSGVEESIIIFNNNWKHGVGVGQYTNALQMYFPYRPVWEYQPVHNVILLFLLEQGLLVAIMFMIVSISILQLIELISLQFLRNSLLLGVVIMPIILFDHYLYSSYVGIMMISIYLGTSIVRYRKEIVNKLKK